MQSSIWFLNKTNLIWKGFSNTHCSLYLDSMYVSRIKSCQKNLSIDREKKCPYFHFDGSLDIHWPKCAKTTKNLAISAPTKHFQTVAKILATQLLSWFQDVSSLEVLSQYFHQISNFLWHMFLSIKKNGKIIITHLVDWIIAQEIATTFFQVIASCNK